MNDLPITTAQQLTQLVRALRKERGQTQSDIARRLGVSTERVAAIEKDLGRVSTRRLLELLQLLDAQLVLRDVPDVPGVVAKNATPPRASSRRRKAPRPAGEW